MYQDDAMLPKAEFVIKYTEQYDELCLRFMRDIPYNIVKRREGVLLPNLAERKQSDGIKAKLVKIYMIYLLMEEYASLFQKICFLRVAAMLKI